MCISCQYFSAVVLYCTISLLLRGHLLFPSPFTVTYSAVTPWESVTSEISDFILSHLYSVFSPFLFLVYSMGLNVLIFSYCRNGGRKTIQLQEGLWF